MPGDDLIVFIGESQPIANAILVPHATSNLHGAEIIVVGFAPPNTTDAATQHYLIRPGTDLALLYGLASILIATGWIDRDDSGAHTAGFEEFERFVTHFTTDIVSEETGIDADDLWHFAQTISDGKRVSFWWTTAVNQGNEAMPYHAGDHRSAGTGQHGMARPGRELDYKPMHCDDLAPLPRWRASPPRDSLPQ